MRVLITVLGSCLVATGTMYPWAWSAAAAADRPVNHAGEPWWSTPPTADRDHGHIAPDEAPAPSVGPKVTEYGRTAAPRSGPKVTELAPPVRTAQAAELAPDPPGTRRPETLPTAFQQDTAPAAEKTKADGAAPSDTAKPLPLPATVAAANPVQSSSAAGTPPADASSPPAAQQDPASPLGLGSHNGKNALGKSSPFSPMITVGGSLALVLGLFLIVAWAMRKTAPRGSLLLPKEVFEILGRAPLGARQQVQLLRCGNKLLLVSITPGGTETLTEVTDPLEVDRIAGVCQQAHPKSSTTAFRQVFQQLAPKSGEPSELDRLPPAGTRRKRYRWEEEHA